MMSADYYEHSRNSLKGFSMLKLTRNVNESIMLYTSDGPIEVVICKINGSQISVGINAPQNVNIVRAEIDETKAS